MAIIPTLIGIVIHRTFPDMWYFYGALYALGAFGMWSTVAEVRRKPAYFAALDRWKKTWICQRCGDKFVP
jgi:hypothetical protein